HGLSVSKLRATINEYCGVSIYRDGFRVHPYGQKGDDWLNLDLRSRLNPSKNLANNQIVGSIRVSRGQNPSIVDRSTREGLVVNDQYQDLQYWFTEALNLLEGQRYDTKPRTDDVRSDSVLFGGLDLKDEIASAKKTLGLDHHISKMIVSADKRVRDEAERIREHLNRLLTLSGLGQMIDLVIHEIGAPLGKINRTVSILESKLLPFTSGLPETCHSPSADWVKDQVPHKINDIKAWSDQIFLLRNRLDPQTPAKRGRATSFDVREEIENTLDLFSTLIDRQAIKVSLDIPNNQLIARMSRASLGQIISNLVDNSLFWLTRHHGKGKGGLLSISLAQIDFGFSITISDDGPGVPLENREIIFDSYYTTKPSGMGLGLYISRMAIEPYGRLLYLDKCTLSGACFTAIFERGVGR
ncbi:MAG: HAMP domain-containing sensor histidine kinase, partial [Desulfovibrionaceae bacterium]|nr:HAMP domain-containing sensor histidine kinase [Desulfovibrionaceae bacterium]